MMDVNLPRRMYRVLVRGLAASLSLAALRYSASVCPSSSFVVAWSDHDANGRLFDRRQLALWPRLSLPSRPISCASTSDSILSSSSPFVLANSTMSDLLSIARQNALVSCGPWHRSPHPHPRRCTTHSPRPARQTQRHLLQCAPFFGPAPHVDSIKTDLNNLDDIRRILPALSTSRISFAYSPTAPLLNTLRFQTTSQDYAST